MGRRRNHHRPYSKEITSPIIMKDRIAPTKEAEGLAFENEAAAHIWQSFLREARMRDANALLTEFDQFHTKLRALFKHYDLDPAKPGDALDLALSLARRHQADDYLVGETVRVSRLFEQYGIDYQSETSDWMAKR